ncbi:hypothetical protein Y032_0367g22 [Ancylostoma ceylanicum]|uniref:Uncharacterized protein n=1 Tax=Ancylostoma ceylanicum TaxID=53326 RepID=A0A016RUN2_9BILA|nr:hypothetical protein Y032_0367g22 [Ancylostoma ceylanicum]
MKRPITTWRTSCHTAFSRYFRSRDRSDICPRKSSLEVDEFAEILENSSNLCAMTGSSMQRHVKSGSNSFARVPSRLHRSITIEPLSPSDLFVCCVLPDSAPSSSMSSFEGRREQFTHFTPDGVTFLESPFPNARSVNVSESASSLNPARLPATVSRRYQN